MRANKRVTHVEGKQAAPNPMAVTEPYVKLTKFCCMYGGGLETGRSNKSRGKLLLAGTLTLLLFVTTCESLKEGVNAVMPIQCSRYAGLDGEQVGNGILGRGH